MPEEMVGQCVGWNELYINEETKQENTNLIDEFTVINKNDIISMSHVLDKSEKENKLKEFYNTINTSKKEEIEKKLLNYATNQGDQSISTSQESSMSDELKHIFGKPLLEVTNDIKANSPFIQLTSTTSQIKINLISSN